MCPVRTLQNCSCVHAYALQIILLKHFAEFYNPRDTNVIGHRIYHKAKIHKIMDMWISDTYPTHKVSENFH